MPEFFSKWRSSCPQVLCKKGVLKNFTKFTGKHLWQSLLFNKVAGLSPATLLKTRSGTCVFLRILWKFQEHLFYRTSPVAASESEGSYYCVYWERNIDKKSASSYNL